MLFEALRSNKSVKTLEINMVSLWGKLVASLKEILR